jgi:hypothetical protein
MTLMDVPGVIALAASPDDKEKYSVAEEKSILT